MHIPTLVCVIGNLFTNGSLIKGLFLFTPQVSLAIACKKHKLCNDQETVVKFAILNLEFCIKDKKILLFSQGTLEFGIDVGQEITLGPKLYIPSTLNIALLQWHTHLNVCAVK